MMRKSRRIILFVLTLMLVTSSISIAIPIQPSSGVQLDYLNSVLDIINNYYVDEVEYDALVNAAYKGVFEELDQYSAYFTSEEYGVYKEDTGGVFGGIGITVTEDDESDFIKVIAPIEGTPGYNAGILTNDLITAVNGNSLEGVTLEEAVKIMRGEPGTKVRLTIKRFGETAPLEFDITREIIEVNPVTFEIREDNIAYLRLKQFNQNAAKDFKQALMMIKEKGTVEGIVLDLRGNPGGRLDQVTEIADMFLEIGQPIVQIDYRAYEDVIIKAEAEPLLKMPVIVLINGGSASASEILAGALQDNGVATVLGETSYGKGTVQSVIDLDWNAGMKITIAHYLTALGHAVNEVGIIPDVLVSNFSFTSAQTAELAPMHESKVYYSGMTGLNVYGAQQRLRLMGMEVSLNAVLDEATLFALKEFQSGQGLEINGVLDAPTTERLKKLTSQDEDNKDDRQLEKAIELITMTNE